MAYIAVSLKKAERKDREGGVAMKVLAAIGLFALGVLLAVIVQHFTCDSSTAYEELKEHYEAKIDSLQSVIEARDKLISAIEDSIKHAESEIAKLHESILKMDHQITYYKGKGRFDYVQSMDSLHVELNRLVKQRLAEVDSTADRTPR
jgi:septal ring factor EnvC (AmiA/AmiB activator)